MGLLTKYLERKREKEVKHYIKGIILDIGCGPATAISYPSVKRYYGVEFKKESVLRLSEKYPSVTFYSKDLEKENIILPEKVDMVLMIAFIEHIAKYEHPIEQAILNLKKGGKIIITTPTKFGNLVHYIGATIGLFSKEARDDHVTILSKRDFLKMARKYSLNLIKYKQFELFCNQLVILKKRRGL